MWQSLTQILSRQLVLQFSWTNTKNFSISTGSPPINIVVYLLLAFIYMMIVSMCVSLRFLLWRISRIEQIARGQKRANTPESCSLTRDNIYWCCAPSVVPFQGCAEPLCDTYHIYYYSRRARCATLESWSPAKAKDRELLGDWYLNRWLCVFALICIFLGSWFCFSAMDGSCLSFNVRSFVVFVVVHV